MDLAFIIVKQVLIMFLIVAVGALCYKLKIITNDGNKQLSKIVLNIVMPAMVFTAYQGEFSTELLTGLMAALLLAVICFVIAIPLSTLVFRKKEGTEYAIEQFSAIYSNCAFMGFPLIEGVFGAEGIFYTTAYVTMFNLLVWTHGVMIMKNEISFKSLLGALKSPTIIAVILGLVCYVTNIRIPESPLKAMNYIASMNTPLAMLVAGVTIAQTNILKALKNGRVYLTSAMRLLILPFISLVIMKFLPVSETVYISIVIASACPTAAIGTLFAINYDRNANYASEIFAVTTLLSAITLPIIVILSRMI